MSTSDTPRKTSSVVPGRPRGFPREALLLMGLAVVLAAAVTMFVMVDETELVLVERFGEIVAVYDRPADRGLQFKWPWPLEIARRFDRRVQIFEPAAREIFTSDKKNILVEAYLCWKIADPVDEEAPRDAAALRDRPVVRFYRSFGSVAQAEQRFDSSLRSILGTRFSQVELSRLLTARSSTSEPNDESTSILEQMADDVRRQLSESTAAAGSGDVDNSESHATGSGGRFTARGTGVEIVELRIRRIQLPAGNQQAVFERMRSERKIIADRLRSEGLADNVRIRSQANRQYQEILARARADAERIRGQGEADAIRILNEAHAKDPEFYRTVRLLESYRRLFNERTTLVLSASSNLLKLLTDGLPKEREVAPSDKPPVTASPVSPPKTSTTPGGESRRGSSKSGETTQGAAGP